MPILATLDGVGLRQQTLLPAAVPIQTFLWRGAQPALVIDRLCGARVALQNPQFGEQLTYRGRQRQVMRAPGIGADGISPGARIAADFALELS